MAALSLRLCLLLVLCLPSWALAAVQAQLDRNQVRLGEVVTLTLRSDHAGQAPDYAPLEQDFLLYAPSVRRHSVMRNGRFVSEVTHVVGLEPRRAGALQVPSLQVGGQWSAPLLLQVVDGPLQGAGPPQAFLRTRLDTASPWVHQSVGVVVALYYASALASGELVQEAPEGAGLQRVGNDRTDQAVVDGRHYNVVERRYLLLPERSGTLTLPPARFRGRAADGGRGRLLTAQQDPPVQVQVQGQPAHAPRPWLPAHAVSLRWEQVPLRVTSGQGFDLVLLAEIDGASRAQLDALPLPAAGPGYRLYPHATEVEEVFDGQRPQLRLRRPVTVVAQAAGHLTLPGIVLPWWDVASGKAAQATLAPLPLQVLPATAAAVLPDTPPEPVQSVPASGPVAADAAARGGVWLAVGLLLAGGLLLWWTMHRRTRPVAAVAAQSLDLAPLLAQGSLQEIVDALAEAAGVAGMAAVLQALADPAQRQALQDAERVWWSASAGDRVAARDRLRRAFASGPHWQPPVAPVPPSALPPLYRDH